MTSPFLRLWYGNFIHNLLGMWIAVHCNQSPWTSGSTVLDLLDQAPWCHAAQPDLCGCTGVAWDVTDFSARAFFWTAGMAGTAEACFVCVASGAGAADVGCMHGAGGGDAGCAAKKQWLDRACSVAVVPLGTVSATLTLHSRRCLHMWQYVEPLLGAY